MVKHFCDKCGAEITHKTTYIVSVRNDYIDLHDEKELCQSCAVDVLNYLNTVDSSVCDKNTEIVIV